MGRNQIIELLSNDAELRNICKKITRNSDLWEDLFQHSLIIVFEKPEDRLNDLQQDNKIKSFLIKVMLNEWNNLRSPFHKAYTNQTYHREDYLISLTSDATSVDACQFDIDKTFQYFTTITPETIQATKTLERLKKEDNQKGSGFPYRTELFKLYLQMGSTRKVQDNVGVNYCSVSKTVKQIKEQIKKGE